MNIRRKLVVGLGAGTLVIPQWSLSQTTGKMYRVGVLSAGDPKATRPWFDAFESGLRDLKYVVGKSVTLIYRFAEGKFERLPDMATELARSKPNVLLAHSTPGSLAAKKATVEIPIVMVGVADPVGAGLVTSLARPEGNVTGLTNITAELAGKRLELLKEIVPQVNRIAVFINPDDANAPLQMKSAENAAHILGIRLYPVVPITSVNEVERAFATALNGGAGAAIRMVDPLSSATRQRTAELTLKHRLPVVYAFREDVEAGSLVGYGTNVEDNFRRAATYIDKILKGAKPSELPIEQPTTFELAVNLKTAKALGITIPQTIMVRATRVIE